ncbi:MAG: UDP-N-acetylglucosamine--N-acetylmuramyl-(pentapeptide) pyrophosphoryl-undecaprenol N-acetylglucosamine transferase [Sedimentisphaerales bacterium]|nr:UDP-N-acetylglucosamine--N-acetylmuramyl-(pentapeptide) pyrophosphoryl-undecaprenol N-acetylglucosamine transferase [Sedimentisphaerales bacterium]
MGAKTFFFAGGGTGGHIYPAVAVAEKLHKLDVDAKIHFFISSRDIDRHVLSKAGFEYSVLPAIGFSARPDKLVRFVKLFLSSRKIAAETIARGQNPVVIGVGGYVAAPVCRAAHRLKIPLALINVDFIPGRANKLIARWADRIFTQFDETAEYFGRYKKKVITTGCPLRTAFDNPAPQTAKDALGLDNDKKILLITGASSGSQNINRTVCSLLEKLSDFANSWQIVHLAGSANIKEVEAGYANAEISHKVLDYRDDMADLLAAADLVIGRSGAVSVAEYAASGVPAICMPYPYHSDMHQYLNAGKLVDAGAAVIVDDVGDDKDRREWLWDELEPLLRDDKSRLQMKQACKSLGNQNAADKIARTLLAE